ncbi:MAG: saccharopine dehydrogenase NADP-binding domain-containing protein [Sphingobacteriaceae bacterium]|nr:saccharopine dehydrogenase NADP-binding domain-containing protein [Sphingobacteriaceae bacterium]
MRKYDILIYGAYGYTGKLVSEQAKAAGYKVLLAGRSKAPLEALATDLQLPFVQVGLEDAAALTSTLAQATVVIHCAGPFSRTAKQMIAACEAAGTHYLDITGELAVIEMLHGRHAIAEKAGIMVMPGVGFDVVPTDCVANRLKAQMPDADTLELAFVTIGGGISHGTLTSAVERLGTGGHERRAGKLVDAPMAKHGKWIDFGEKKRFVISIPWGDLCTAWLSTSIPNITTYTGGSPKLFPWLKLMPLINPLLRTRWMRNLLQQQVDKKVTGPNAEQNQKGYALVYGRVSNSKGEVLEQRLRVNETYLLTAQTAVLIAGKVLAGNATTGFRTPAMQYGADLITEVPGCRWL